MVKLSSCVFPVGTKFAVSPLIKNSIYPPSSVGFIGSFNGQFRNLPNVVILDVSVIRKGKKGKQRVENVLLTTQVFDIEMERKKLKLDEFKGYPFVHITSVDNIHSSVADMEPLEFLGWGAAHFAYLADLYKNADVARRWPKDELNPVNMVGNIYNEFRKDPVGTLDVYAAEEFRMNFAHELRRMETSVAKTVLQHRLTLSAAELKASAYLLWDNMKEKDKLYDKRVITSNYNFHRRKYTALQHLIFRMDTARYESFIDKERRSILNYRIDKPALMNSVARVPALIKLFAKRIYNGRSSPHFQHLVFQEGKGNERKVRAEAMEAVRNVATSTVFDGGDAGVVAIQGVDRRQVDEESAPPQPSTSHQEFGDLL